MFGLRTQLKKILEHLINDEIILESFTYNIGGKSNFMVEYIPDGVVDSGKRSLNIEWIERKK